MGKERPRSMHARVTLASKVSNRLISVLENGATGKEEAILGLITRLRVRSACRAGRFAAMSWRPFCWMEANRVSMWVLKSRFIEI